MPSPLLPQPHVPTVAMGHSSGSVSFGYMIQVLLQLLLLILSVGNGVCSRIMTGDSVMACSNTVGYNVLYVPTMSVFPYDGEGVGSGLDCGEEPEGVPLSIWSKVGALLCVEVVGAAESGRTVGDLLWISGSGDEVLPRVHPLFLSRTSTRPSPLPSAQL